MFPSNCHFQVKTPTTASASGNAARMLLMQVLGGFSADELAQLEQTTSGAITTRLSRARQWLCTQMQARHPGRWAQARELWRSFLQPKPAFFAIAASLTIAVGLLVMQTSTEHKANWSEVILVHALGEADSLNLAGSFSERDFSVALKAYGLTTKNNLGKIRFIGHCPLPGGRGIHAVIDTPDLGQVTLILPPVGVQASPSVAQREGYAAQITYVNRASIGIITQQPDKLVALSNHLHEQIVASL